MRWDDERYVRVYTRDTPGWCLLSWEARSVFLLLLRVVDRAGILHFGHAGSRAVAAVLRAPEDVVSRALEELNADGCVQVKADWMVIPNFVSAQETPVSDAARKRDSRARAKARAMEDAPTDTERPDMSRAVTQGHSDPICADPICADPDALLARARVESPPEPPQPTEPEQPPELTLAETFAAEGATPRADLDALARELAEQGNAFGARCLSYLDTGQALPGAMRGMLRKIADERAKHADRPSGVRRVMSVTAEEQALSASAARTCRSSNCTPWRRGASCPTS